jgi:hypothetical protein
MSPTLSNEALIERVRAGNWNPDNDENDRQNRNALAARGYWQAFQRVKKSLEPILAGENPAIVVRRDYDAWYAELFAPRVSAGLPKAADLAGFRNGAVYIRTRGAGRVRTLLLAAIRGPSSLWLVVPTTGLRSNQRASSTTSIPSPNFLGAC